MLTLLNILLIFCFMYSLENRRKFSFLNTFPFVVSVTMLFFFLMTQGGLLQQAKIFWVGFAILLFSKCALENWRNGTPLLSRQHVFFMAGMSIVFMLFNGGSIIGCDPYFWADFSKYIHMNNDYWSATSSVFHSAQHQAYPPGFAIISNIYNGLFPYAEYIQYIAFATPLLFLALITVKLSGDYIGSNNYVKFLLAFFCFCAIKTLGAVNPVNFLNADIAIAGFFATCLLISLYEKDIQQAFWLLIVMLPAFTLLKTTCLLLSLTVILIFGIRIYTTKNNEKLFYTSRLAFLIIVSILPIVLWDIMISSRHIVSATAHLNTMQIISFFDEMTTLKQAFINDTIRYFFLKPTIYIYPKIFHPLTSTFALILYSTFLFLMTHKKVHGRQLQYFLCLLICFTGWFLIHLVVVAFVLPDALSKDVVSRTYPRYIGAFICPMFIVALVGYILHCGQWLTRTRFTQLISIIILLFLPFYGAGIYQRSHPSLEHSPLPPIFKHAFEQEWHMVNASQLFIIENTPPGAQVWTLLNENGACQGMQMGFSLRPCRDNEMPLGIHYGMSGAETRQVLLKKGVSHIYVLSPKTFPLQEYGDPIQMEASACPVLIDIRPWSEGSEEIKIIPFTNAFWCKQSPK